MSEPKCHCGEPATHAWCEPASPWYPSCHAHIAPYAMSVVPISDYARVNAYVPKMFGGTHNVQ